VAVNRKRVPDFGLQKLPDPINHNSLSLILNPIGYKLCADILRDLVRVAGR
jgi:hypothetical protein